jgi:hypothetical protein
VFYDSTLSVLLNNKNLSKFTRFIEEKSKRLYTKKSTTNIMVIIIIQQQQQILASIKIYLQICVRIVGVCVIYDTQFVVIDYSVHC